MLISKGFTCGYNCRIEAYSLDRSGPTLIMGENLNIGDSCHITSMQKVQFGKDVLVGSSVFITDHDHGDDSFDSLSLPPNQRELICKPVLIDDNVWIGEKVVILKGVTIGRNSIIGAGSVVTKDVPPYSVAVGVPAKITKTHTVATSK